MQDKIEYDSKEIVGVLRDLWFLIRALDRIGGVASEHPNPNQYLEKELLDFHKSAEVIEVLASMRTILEKPFESFSSIDDVTFLERAYKDIQHWEDKNKKGHNQRGQASLI